MQQPVTSALDFVRATVHANAFEVDYVRVGRGSPVLLLLGSPGSGPLRAALCRSLAASFRVLAPESASSLGGVGKQGQMPGQSPALQIWLRAFLEGLGVSQVSVVADEHFGAAALGFALLEPERVARLILLRGLEFAADAMGEPVLESIGRPDLALPVLHLTCAPGTGHHDPVPPSFLKEVNRFLSAGDFTSPQRP